MKNNEKRKELRKHKRLHNRQGAVAALEESKSGLKVGLIANISKSGLAFCYLDHIIMEKKTNETYKPVISWQVSDFFMDNIPCEVVSDEEVTVTPSAGSSACTIPMRLCRVQLGELMPDQSSKLKHFLENFTNDPTTG